jgi:hypothetical protein
MCERNHELLVGKDLEADSHDGFKDIISLFACGD